MAKYVVRITYEPVPLYDPENASEFDPPFHEDNLADRQRVYTTVVHARSESEVFRKALASRREAPVEKRIYDTTIVGKTVTLYP